jgi:hypothetical protein
MEIRVPFLISIIALSISVFPAAGADGEGEAKEIKEIIDKTTPQGRAAFQTQEMKRELGLNQDQIDKVREINLKYARKAETTVDASQGGSRKLGEMKEISDEKDREMKVVLSSEQYDKYLAMKEQMRKKMLDSTGG